MNYYRIFYGLVVILSALAITVHTLVGLIRELQGRPRLSPGLCKIQESLPNSRYDVFFTPNITGQTEFSTVVKADRPGFTNFSIGAIVPCYGRFCGDSCSEKNRVQFHSARKDRNNSVLILLAVFLPITVFPVAAGIWWVVREVRKEPQSNQVEDEPQSSPGDIYIRIRIDILDKPAASRSAIPSLAPD